MARIISASRRTDIPRFYGDWFAERRREGTASFRTAFGFEGTVSLAADDVLGYLFWTKDARPFRGQLEQLLSEGVACAFQYTITGYGRPLEPYIPPPERVVEDLRSISALLPSPRCVQWRYDPIVLCDEHPAEDHLERFQRLAAALEGATEVVNISFVEPYLKALRRIDDSSVRYRRFDPARHKTVAKRYPSLPLVGEEAAELLGGMERVAREHGMELRACANPEWGIPAAQCCSAEMFSPYSAELAVSLERLKVAPTRDACRCLESVDIGMDNTCVGGCLYCYVVSSHEAALANRKQHDPKAPSLR